MSDIADALIAIDTCQRQVRLQACGCSEGGMPSAIEAAFRRCGTESAGKRASTGHRQFRFQRV